MRRLKLVSKLALEVDGVLVVVIVRRVLRGGGGDGRGEPGEQVETIGDLEPGWAEGIDGPEKEAEDRCPQSAKDVCRGANEGVQQGAVGYAEPGEVKNDDDHGAVSDRLRDNARIGDGKAYSRADEDGSYDVLRGEDTDARADSAAEQDRSDGVKTRTVRSAVVDDDGFEAAERRPAHGLMDGPADQHGGRDGESSPQTSPPMERTQNGGNAMHSF